MKNLSRKSLLQEKIDYQEKQIHNSDNNFLLGQQDKSTVGLSRRNLLKIASVVGGGGLINLTMGSPAMAGEIPQLQNIASQTPQLDYNEILIRAHDRLYPACRVCPVCDGIACSGDNGGMSGAGTGMSFQNNFTSLQRVKLLMRNLHDVTKPDTSITIFGCKLSFPAVCAPMGPVATKYGKGMPKEEWFPALLGGCVDASTMGGIGDNFQTYPAEDSNRNLATLASFRGKGFYNTKPNSNEVILKWRDQIEASGAAWLTIDVDSGPKSVSQLREIVKAFKIPVVVKGIMMLDDALRCIDSGVAGIVVSNHGGRRLDHTQGTAEALPVIAAKLKGKIPIFTDGCVATGADVLKYLALGADVVMVGRHLLRASYGGGREGVALFMNKMRTELQSAMVCTGVQSVEQINNSIIHI